MTMTSSADARGPHRPRRSRKMEQAGENRDVAARDRDHVIRARFLQPPLDVFVEPRAIADQNRRHDGRRSRAPWRDARRDRAADRRAHGGRRFRQWRAPIRHVDEPVALDRTHQRDPAPRQLPLRIAGPWIQIPRGQSKRGRKRDAAARAPLQNAIGPQFAAHANGGAARGWNRRAVERRRDRQACRA